jgi:hypothetical protein
MAQCDVCGSDFEPHAFQVLVGGRSGSYDRIDCAERARLIGAGTAAFALPHEARTIVVPPPAAPVAAGAVAPAAGVVAPFLARASAARGRLAFGGAWLLSAGLAAGALYVASLPEDDVLTAAGPPSAPTATPSRGDQPATVFVHDADAMPALPQLVAKTESTPERDRDRARPAAKPEREPAVLARSTSTQSKPAAPAASTPPAPPAPPPAAAPAPAAPSKPGWGHGDKKHEHFGPPGKSKPKKH